MHLSQWIISSFQKRSLVNQKSTQLQDPKGILEDDVLPDGTKVKAGGMVTYVPYSMGRMKYNWGADATSFKPERWLKDGCFLNASPFKFTAFQVIQQSTLTVYP